MEPNIQLWIISGIATLLFLVTTYLLKTTIAQILGKIDTVINELQTLGKSHSSQEERIKYLHEASLELSMRLNAHTERLFRLESKVHQN